jgi:hypothetical protein
MAQPSSVQDNFTTHVTLENNPSFYNVRAFVYNWFYLQSYSAFGEYQLNFTILINGVNALTAYGGIVWSHENYGLSAQGPIPDISVQENITNLHIGDNVFEFRFIQYSKLSQYGTGYYYLKLGPFSINVSGRPVSIVGPLALETGVGVLLLPASHFVSLLTFKYRRKIQPPAKS